MEEKSHVEMADDVKPHSFGVGGDTLAEQKLTRKILLQLDTR